MSYGTRVEKVEWAVAEDLVGDVGLPDLDVAWIGSGPLSTLHGVEPPCPGHAFEFMLPSLLELDPRSDDQRRDSA